MLCIFATLCICSLHIYSNISLHVYESERASDGWSTLLSLHVYESLCMCTRASDVWSTSLDVYCSTAQGLLDWCEVDLGFTELLFIQIILCVMCTRASDVWSTIKFLSANVHLFTYIEKVCKCPSFYICFSLCKCPSFYICFYVCRKMSFYICRNICRKMEICREICRERCSLHTYSNIPLHMCESERASDLRSTIEYIYVWQFPLEILHPRNPPNQKLRFLGVSWYKFKERFWIDLNLYRGVCFSRFDGLRGCGILSGICHTCGEIFDGGS